MSALQIVSLAFSCTVLAFVVYVFFDSRRLARRAEAAAVRARDYRAGVELSNQRILDAEARIDRTLDAIKKIHEEKDE